jgi:hypothetical protein
VTEALARRVMVLPTGTGVGEDDICAIGELLRFAAAHAQAIRECLKAGSAA